MLDPLSPLILPATYHPDFSEGDWDDEIDRHWERQVLVDQLLAGEIPLEILLDCLGTQGVNVDQYCIQTTERIDRAIRADIALQMDPNEIGAYVR